MPNASHRSFLPARQREKVSQLQKLLREQGLLRASFIRMRRRCGRNYCRCNRAKKNWHSSWYIVQRHHGKPRLQHVPAAMESTVEKWIRSYREAKKMMNVISDIYWNQLKQKP